MNWSIFRSNRMVQALTGALVFLISFFTYLRTVAPTTSFWDCGEFIACSLILGVIHPPGAPLYLLIGRLMTMLPLAKDIGLRVNLFSVLISATTVWITFLVIGQLIKRWRGEPKTGQDRLIQYGSAALGALAFAFTDSFWFNAVEAEVYAFSMFFTAIAVWLTLFWEERSEGSAGLPLILIIFYLFGLAVGVHLLNMLVFPFVILIAFFHHNQTVRRLLMLVFVQAAVPMLLYILLYQFNPETMAYNEILDHQANAGRFMKWFGLIWLAVTLFWMYRKDRFVFKIWWILPVLLAITYSIYLVIYIRANLHPPINENDPSTWAAMMDYLARKQYGVEDMFLTFMHRKADFWNYQIQKMYTRYFGWQFIGRGSTYDVHDFIKEIISFKGLYGLPFLVGLWGAFHHFFKDWKRALAVLVLFFMTGYAIIIYLNQPDPQPRERDYSYVGSFFAFALWIGVGMAGILEWISEAFPRRKTLAGVLQAAVAVLLFIAVPLNLFAFNFDSHDRTGNYVPVDYSWNILESCEKDAVIFTNGDNDTFPLWYLQEVEKVRKDIRIVNLSLLNTAWYIKQLRDEEPKVPINLTDEQIDDLAPIAWKTQERYIPVPEDLAERLRSELPPEIAAKVKDRITFNVKPTIGSGASGGIKVHDIMVMRILQESRWKRPVYFAVTVSNDNMVGLHSYFRMDGLAFKIMPYEVDDVDPKVLQTNLTEKYRYRGLDNPDLYLDRTTLRLMGNYRSAFMQLADYYLANGQAEEARLVLDGMTRKIPPHVIPYSDERSVLAIADLYRRTGMEMNLDDMIRQVMVNHEVGVSQKLMLARYYAGMFQNWGRAEELLKEVLAERPGDVQASSQLLQVYTATRQYDKGIALLENWLASVNPGDANARQQLDELKAMAADTARKNP